MKTKHGLSGIYFRCRNEETGNWESVVFEDLPEEEQNSILDTKSPEFIKGLVKQLSDTLYNVAETFDLFSSHEN